MNPAAGGTVLVDAIPGHANFEKYVALQVQELAPFCLGDPCTPGQT